VFSGEKWQGLLLRQQPIQRLSKALFPNYS
jgi:hypothetical protein